MDWKATIGYKPFGSPADLNAVLELEAKVGVPLPPEYRAFLLNDGGGYVSHGFAVCTEPTPFGEHTISQLHGVSQVTQLLDSSVTPRNMICIGFGNFGATTCLSVAGLDHGMIFSLDTEMRYFWQDDVLSKWPSLGPSIQEFFRLRDSGELAERPWGYENCYHVADSFGEFLLKLHMSEE